MLGLVGEDGSTLNHEARWSRVETDERRRRVDADGDWSDDGETDESKERAADRRRISAPSGDEGDEAYETEGDDAESLSRREAGEGSLTMSSGTARG
jgi:hypothetical protein